MRCVSALVRPHTSLPHFCDIHVLALHMYAHVLCMLLFYGTCSLLPLMHPTCVSVRVQAQVVHCAHSAVGIQSQWNLQYCEQRM